MSEQWYCPDCGPITKMREEFLSGGYMCAECEAPASPIPAFVTVLQQQIAQRDTRIATLEAIINKPHTNDFLQAVSIEAEHQRMRWGAAHDEGKAAADWFWLIGYLAGKALHAHINGITDKAEHHVITTAAACENWHRAIQGKTDMRPGTAQPVI